MNLRFVRSAVLIAIASLPAFASTIEVNFSGFINESNFTSVSIGDSFSGTVYYSTDAAPIETDPSGCFPPVQSSPCAAHYLFPNVVSISLDGSSVTSIPQLGAISGDNLQVSWGAATGSFVAWIAGFYQMAVTGPLASEMSSIDVLSVDFVGPSSLLTAPQLGASFPAINEWDGDFSTITFSTSPGIGQDGEALNGIVTAINSEVVPEPGTFPLLIFGISVVLLRRLPNGISSARHTL